jgi:branched-subunit amino acid aminotransferase/4-amino-4-deoxychorismate lyase
VQEVCLHGEGGGLGEELVDLETGLQANRVFAGEQKVQRGTESTELGKGLDVGKFFHLPVHSQRLYKSLKILGLKMPLSGHLEALSNRYWGQA